MHHGGSLLLDLPGRPSAQIPSSSDSSPSCQDLSRFPSPGTSPYGLSPRNLPQIRVDTNSHPQSQGHIPSLSPTYQSQRSSGPSSGGGSSIALPITPSTSPMYSSTSLPMIRGTSIHSTSPVSPSYLSIHTPSSSVRTDMIFDQYPMHYNPTSLIAMAEGEMKQPEGLVVPQSRYRPHTQSDRRRYVEDVQLAPPIEFRDRQTGYLGISLRDALNNRFMDLMGRDEPMFDDRGPSVSIRLNVRTALFSLPSHAQRAVILIVPVFGLQWPGYTPWSRQIPTKDFRSPPLPITRAKLARNVAKTVQRFIVVSRVFVRSPSGCANFFVSCRRSTAGPSTTRASEHGASAHAISMWTT